MLDIIDLLSCSICHIINGICILNHLVFKTICEKEKGVWEARRSQVEWAGDAKGLELEVRAYVLS